MFLIFLFKIDICKKKEFQCDNNKCIANYLVCNGRFDCTDLSDEKDCKRIFLLLKVYKCKEKGAFCNNGECILVTQICDGIFNCQDFSDETGCKINKITHLKKDCSLFCDGKCLKLHNICNHIKDCSDGSDENDCGILRFNPGHESPCDSLKFRPCDGGNLCYLETEMCNGISECPDYTDELFCPGLILNKESKI